MPDSLIFSDSIKVIKGFKILFLIICMMFEKEKVSRVRKIQL